MNWINRVSKGKIEASDHNCSNMREIHSTSCSRDWCCKSSFTFRISPIRSSLSFCAHASIHSATCHEYWYHIFWLAFIYACTSKILNFNWKMNYFLISWLCRYHDTAIWCSPRGVFSAVSLDVPGCSSCTHCLVNCLHVDFVLKHKLEGQIWRNR